MRWLGLAALEEATAPIGLVVAGAAVGLLAMPLVKRVGHTALVLGTRGVLAINDQVKESTAGINRGWEQIVQEARSGRDMAKEQELNQKLHEAKVHLAQKGIIIADAAKRTADKVKRNWNELVEEARQDMQESPEQIDQPQNS